MKLIANKPPESLFRIFPEIDTRENPLWNDRWTDRNPAVMSGKSIVIPGWATTINGLNSPRWFAFKALGKRDYVVSFNYEGTGSCALDLSVYDYLDYGSSGNSAFEPLQTGRVGTTREHMSGDAVHHAMTIRLDWSRVLLVSAKPAMEGYESYYLNGFDVTLTFSRDVEAVNCSTHLVRDWKNGIDGTWWNAGGKVYRWASLEDIGRRISPPPENVSDSTQESAET